MKKITLLVCTLSLCMVSVFSQFTQQANPLGTGNGDLGKVQFVSANEGWIACGSNGSLLHTTNGGSDWSIVTPFPSEVTGNPSDIGLTMNWVNQSHGWALKTYCDNFEENSWNGSNGGVMYKTVNGGSSWSEIKLPKTITPVEYSSSDLVGNWQVHMLSAINLNKSNSTSSWTYGNGSIDLSGVLSFTLTESNGSSSSVQAPISVDSRGKVNLSGSFGFLSSDKQMMVLCDNYKNQTPTLFVFQKQNSAITYSPSDLQGDWSMHVLSTGTSTGTKSGYAYGTMSFNSGQFSGTLHGPENSSFPTSIYGSITPDGVISLGSNTHGFMSADKQSFVSVMTDDGGAYNLFFFQKKLSSLTYLQSDLLGLWQGYSLVSDNINNSQISANWGRQQLQIGSTGTVAISHMVVSGVNCNDVQAQVSLSSDGVMSISGMPEAHAFLSPNKNILIQLNPDGGGGYSFGVSLRDLSISGDVGVQTQFTSETVGWCSIYNPIYENFMLFKTTDGGNNWTQINGVSNPVGGYYCFIDNTNGWMFGQKGVSSTQEQSILHTTDGGLSWEIQKGNLGNSVKKIFFTDNLHGWAVGYNGLIIKTTDGGVNWVAITPAITYPSGYTTIVHKSIYFVDNNNGFVSTDLNNEATGFNKNYIIRTTDGGNSWSCFDPGISNSIFDMYFVDKNNGWIIGESGGDGVYTGLIVRAQLPPTGINDPGLDNQVSVYPNPISDSFVIKGLCGTFSVQLIDLGGQVLKNQMIKTSDEKINVSTLPKGMYVLKITTGKNTTLKKIIKE